MKGKDPFKGMPSWKGKGKGDAKNKGGNNPFMSQPPQANVAQPASSSASQAPEKQETAHAEESWSYDYDTYWTDDWSGYESYLDMMEIAPKVIGTIGLTLLPLRNWPNPRTSSQKV